MQGAGSAGAALIRIRPSPDRNLIPGKIKIRCDALPHLVSRDLAYTARRVLARREANQMKRLHVGGDNAGGADRAIGMRRARKRGGTPHAQAKNEMKKPRKVRANRGEWNENE